MKPSNIVAAAALLGCVILVILLFRAQNELTLANAALATLRSSNADLTARITELEGKAIDESLLQRMRADQREAIKLRGEVGALKKSLAAAESKAAAAIAAAQKTSQTKSSQPSSEPSANPYTRVFGRKLTANLALGHGLLFGGWQSEPGKQTFAMAVPSRDSGGETVTVQTRLFDVSDQALEKLDKTLLLHAASQQATMTPDQLANFLKTLESTPGIDVLSAPRVTAFSGQQATVSVGNKMPTPDGAMVDMGTKIDLIPTISPDGSSVELAVDAKLTLPNAPPAP
jgi:hypothetical protein